ncbi:MAG: M13 family metallopeptidase [Blastocatellia bacterium]|jgi:predicted metalloendopeptidase|nr:M13 family metallopeptidase [Blastocatellia bacterium]
MRFSALSLATLLCLTPTAASASGTGGAAQPEPPTAAGAGFDITGMDTTCKPCDDFNRFANGGWLVKNAIPAEYPSWGTFNQLRDRNLDALKSILEEAAQASAPKGTSEQKIGDFFASAMDVKLIDELGAKPLEGEFKRIAAISDAASLQDAIAHLHMIGVGATFEGGSIPDFKNSTMTVYAVGQSGLGLPDRDYYVNDDERSKKIRDEYVAHLTKMFGLIGDDAATSAANAKTVMEFETRLAGGSLKNTELRDPAASYHMMTLAERKALTPTFSWERYESAIGLKSGASINVAHPKFIQEVDAMMKSVPLDAWKTYLRWMVVNSFADTLSTPFVDQNFAFRGAVLTGAKQQQPRWKKAVQATSGMLGEPLGEVYVKKYFPAESKRRMKEMVANLKAALREDLEKLEWMQDATRKAALAKLDSFTDKIGYPDKWKDYSTLEIERGPYVTNVMRGRMWGYKDDLAKVGKAVDRTEWGMTPQTVNASYNPLNNDITFPAGILQSPFFMAEADDAVNYGAIGAVIGHEITHGFDDQGRQFDAKGNLTDWWTEADGKNFEGRAKCIVDQYSEFTIDGGKKVNGELVQGEAIADIGGLKIAYAAYKRSLKGKPEPKPIDGYTHEQRFFLGYARVWAAQARPEFEQLQVNTNVHALPRFRLVGTLANMPEFHAAFGCKDGDKMVRGNANRCVIW